MMISSEAKCIKVLRGADRITSEWMNEWMNGYWIHRLINLTNE